MQVPVTIQTYSGYKSDERPTSFMVGRERLRVLQILDRWYSPDATCFKVVANNSRAYLLRHTLNLDQWELDAV